MPVQVNLPTILRSHAGGAKTVSVEGSTVGEVLVALAGSTRACRARSSTTTGSLHKFVNVYLNDDDVRYLSSLDTPVEDSDEISILPAVAGGAVATGRPPPMTVVRLRPGTDRQHPAGGHQPAEPQSRRPASSIKLEGQNPGGRSRTGSPCP